MGKNIEIMPCTIREQRIVHGITTFRVPISYNDKSRLLRATGQNIKIQVTSETAWISEVTCL